MKRVNSLLVLCFIIFQSVKGQPPLTAEVQKNSSLTISGSTNVVPFKLYQNGDKLSKTKLTVTPTFAQNKIFLSQNQLSVVVKNFASPNFMALKDFLSLIKSDKYPTLQVQINYLDIDTNSENGDSFKGNALVSITITGITRNYSIPISSKNNGEIYCVDGNKRMSIRDFGLTPKSRMMGLIKVSEWINIDFHMICKITGNDTVARN
jgi:hypothetical protein